ncbi:MAG: tetratricopeptide repeat protein [Planctomycetota bacterium]
MGLFDLFRKSKRSKSRIAPTSPLAVAKEVERLIETGELREALEVAEKGVYDYPRSEVVNSAYRFLKRTALGEDVVTLRREVEASPSAVKYSQLAEAYKEIGDYDKALETCNRSIDLYPEHEGAWIVLAQIRMERFREDWIPRDAELAIDFYERAFDLNRSSYRTLIELAELYTELGIKRRAIRKCEAILYFAPDDEKALHILRKAQALSDRSRDELSERIAQYADKKRRAMQRRSFRPGDPLGPSGRLIKDPALLQEKLDTVIDKLAGARWAVGLTLDGEGVAASSSIDIDRDVAAKAAHTIFEAANRCSLLMDIGHFKRGVFEGEQGLVFLVDFDQLRLLVKCEPRTRLDRADDAIKKFVEDDLYR